ncbi:MAG: CHAD domain-containing protein [Verrucomicrobia bacterium]|nr:CHAD domain-containing protein [Verrucomicrobiota bacterium]
MSGAQRMMKLTIGRLCSKYQNEDAHTEHVTALALRLFDATHKRLRIPAADRALLKAAGRLHDVGYSVNTLAHREAGADLVLREGLGGYSDADRDLIAAVMLLHSGAVPALRRHRQVRRLSDPRRALRLGALLRIADGLDYGHQQDAAIKSVEFNTDAVRVTVRSSRFPYNIERADQKSDLWWSVFPLGIEIVPAIGGRDADPTLLRRNLHVLEAARRLLSLQFKIVLINVDSARKGESSKPLHDIRVAIRRACAVLRAFRKPLAGTSAEKISRVLQRLNRALGPPRDADVAVAFLTSDDVRKQFAQKAGWPAFIRHQIYCRRQLLPVVRRQLADRKLAALKVEIGRLLRIEMPQLIKNVSSVSLEKLARRRLRKEFCRTYALARLRRSKSSDDLHRFRIALRRVRYLGEFFSPVLGTTVATLKERVHAVERSLARIHDIDVGLLRLASGRLEPPHSLVSLLKQRRREHQVKLDKTWRRFNRPAFQRSIRRKLKIES